MSLYLTGGGDQENFTTLDGHFLNALPQDAKLLVLPWAVDPEDYQDVLERLEECFHHKRVSKIDLAQSPEDLTLDFLLQYEALIIEGGNTFQLIKTVRQTNAFTLIKDYYQKGKMIYADSAGAIILGEDVQTAFLGDDADEDHESLQDYRGIGVAQSWTIHAHYEADDFDNLNDLLYDKGHPIIALPEEGGILIRDNTIYPMGSSPIDLITFGGKIKLTNDEQFSF